MIEESKQTVLDEEDFMEYKVCYVKIVTLEFVDNPEVRSTWSFQRIMRKYVLWLLKRFIVIICEIFSAEKYMFRFFNKSTRLVCVKLTKKTPEPCPWRRSGVFINFK